MNCCLYCFIRHSEALLNELSQTALNRVMSQPCWPRRPRQPREKFIKSTWTSSHYPHPSTTGCHLLFLPLSNFASRLLRLLFSRHIPPPPISLFLSLFLVGLCCPQGVWDSFGDSLYVSWPELRRWGSFDGAGIIHPVRWAVQHCHPAAPYTYCMYIDTDTDFLRSKLWNFPITPTRL